MCDEENSSQVKLWLFTPDLLKQCRETANRKARHAIIAHQKKCKDLAPTPCVSAPDVVPSETTDSNSNTNGNGNNNNTTNDVILPVESFASGYTIAHRGKDMIEDETITEDTYTANEWNDIQSNPFLSSEEEQLLIQFYAGKLPSLIGPNATIPRLRRDVKVLATAALLFRRFFCSNSVLLHDPKCIMVASAFLGSKVEDATVDIRYLEEGTKLMQAPVSIQEILDAEVSLIDGVDFDLMCFHPYKAVLAFTEDLRTYLKSDRGKKLVKLVGGGAEMTSHDNYTISGEDLRPIHDEARQIIDDVCVSDIPLLYTPGQIGLAAMMLSNQQLLSNTTTTVPQIDFYGYTQNRFDRKKHQEVQKYIQLFNTMRKLTVMLKELRDGKYGCGNHGINMEVLKGVHKKLKKCRVWVGDEKDDGKKKKKKKRKAVSSEGDAEESDAKKIKESDNE